LKNQSPKLDAKIDELRSFAAGGSGIGDEISRLEEKSRQSLDE